MRLAEPRSALREPPPLRSFLIIWTGQAFSLLGSSLVQFALIWYLTKSTGSATVLALASIVGLLPQIFIGPFAGVLVDRWNRRAVLMLSDSLIALATALLAGLFILNVVCVWHVYLLLFVRSLGSAFQWPAMQASTSLMVPKQHLARVGGMNQALQGAASIVTPPLGALLFGLLPMPAILAIDVSTAFLAVGPLFFIFVPQPDRGAAGPAPAAGPALAAEPAGPPGADAAPSLMADLREGARYMWGFSAMLILVIMGTMIRLLVWPGSQLLPIMVTHHFGGGPLQLAYLEAAGGSGLVLGGIVLGLWGGFKRRIVTAMVALLLDGIAISVIGLCPPSGLSLAGAAFFCSGFVESFHFGATGAIFQAVVPPALQGRLLGLIGGVGTAMVPLGLAVAGPVADAYGVQIWFLVGGLATAAMAASTFFIRSIMHIEEVTLTEAPAARIIGSA